MRRYVAVGLGATVLAAWFVAGASRPQPGTASEIAHAVMSPYCPGLTLAACPSGEAVRLRAELADRLAAGEAPAAVTDSLVRRFGPRVRASPDPHGAALALWVAPAVLAMAALLGLVVSGGRPRRLEAPAAGPDAAEARFAARLDEELERLD
jgi:cytochrome c-type biogenesis protein CcmH/NrfF